MGLSLFLQELAELIKLWHKKSSPALIFRPELGLGGSQALEEPTKTLSTRPQGTGGPCSLPKLRGQPVLCLFIQ